MGQVVDKVSKPVEDFVDFFEGAKDRYLQGKDRGLGSALGSMFRSATDKWGSPKKILQTATDWGDAFGVPYMDELGTFLDILPDDVDQSMPGGPIVEYEGGGGLQTDPDIIEVPMGGYPAITSGQTKQAETARRGDFYVGQPGTYPGSRRGRGDYVGGRGSVLPPEYRKRRPTPPEPRPSPARRGPEHPKKRVRM
jgi:hypothetical protein